MRRTLPFAAITLVWHPFAFPQASVPQDATILLLPQQHSKGIFESSDLARRVAALVLEKAEVSFDAEPTAIVDEGAVWSITFAIKKWPKRMETLRPGLPEHLTIRIRKRDGAILSAR